MYELASTTWGEEEIAAINKVVEGGYFTMGPTVEKFEKTFADMFGSKYAVMVNSGSSANLIGVAALCFTAENNLKPGDEVIVPAISWATTYYPLMQYGLKLKFLDVDLETLNMDITKLEEALTPKTKMVMAVNILGNPCELDKIKDFCNKNKLYLFEDNCESMGATLNNKQCGTFGDIGTFSTFFSHHISTMEGGVCITDNEELYHLMLAIRSHGWTRHLPDNTKIYDKKKDDFFEAYRFIVPGYNVRPTELNAAIGLEQLKKLPDFIEYRRENGKHWQELFSDNDKFMIQRETGNSSWFAFTVIPRPEYKDKLDRKALMQKLTNNDIQYRIITGGNFLRHDVIKYCDYDVVSNVVNADYAHDYGFFVGNHPVDVKENLSKVYNILSETGRNV